MDVQELRERWQGRAQDGQTAYGLKKGNTRSARFHSGYTCHLESTEPGARAEATEKVRR